MPLVQKGEWFAGDSHADLREYLARYSADGYPIHHFVDLICGCGGSTFSAVVDETEGVAVRTCTACGLAHPIGDSDEFMADAELEECACPCGSEHFQLTVGVALYSESEDVKWAYLGCRCVKCGILGCFGDWKNEYPDYRAYLKKC